MDATTFDALAKLTGQLTVAGLLVGVIYALFKRIWMPAALHREIVDELKNQYEQRLAEKDEQINRLQVDSDRWRDATLSSHSAVLALAQHATQQVN